MAVDAGSIYSEIRIRIDRLQADLNTVRQEFQNTANQIETVLTAPSENASEELSKIGVAAQAAGKQVDSAFASEIQTIENLISQYKKLQQEAEKRRTVNNSAAINQEQQALEQLININTNYGQELSKINELRSQGMITAQQQAQAEQSARLTMVSGLNDIKNHYTQLPGIISAANSQINNMGAAFNNANTNGTSFFTKLSQGFANLANPVYSVMGIISQIGNAIKGVASKINEITTAYHNNAMAVARLDAVVQATGASSWTTTQRLEDMARALSQSTGYAINDIEAAQAVLLGYRNITGDVFGNMMNVITNIAAVMRTDMASAAQTFGKAMDSPINGLTSLRRVGFDFNEVEAQTIKQLEQEGRLWEAQEILIKEFNRTFGQTATAMNTAGGAVSRLKNAQEAYKVEMGRSTDSIWNYIAALRAKALEERTQKQKANNDAMDAEKRLNEEIALRKRLSDLRKMMEKQWNSSNEEEAKRVELQLSALQNTRMRDQYTLFKKLTDQYKANNGTLTGFTSSFFGFMGKEGNNAVQKRLDQLKKDAEEEERIETNKLQKNEENARRQAELDAKKEADASKLNAIDKNTLKYKTDLTTAQEEHNVGLINELQLRRKQEAAYERGYEAARNLRDALQAEKDAGNAAWTDKDDQALDNAKKQMVSLTGEIKTVRGQIETLEQAERDRQKALNAEPKETIDQAYKRITEQYETAKANFERIAREVGTDEAKALANEQVIKAAEDAYNQLIRLNVDYKGGLSQVAGATTYLFDNLGKIIKENEKNVKLQKDQEALATKQVTTTRDWVEQARLAGKAGKNLLEEQRKIELEKAKELFPDPKQSGELKKVTDAINEVYEAKIKALDNKKNDTPMSSEQFREEFEKIKTAYIADEKNYRSALDNKAMSQKKYDENIYNLNKSTNDKLMQLAAQYGHAWGEKSSEMQDFLGIYKSNLDKMTDYEKANAKKSEDTFAERASKIIKSYEDQRKALKELNSKGLVVGSYEKANDDLIVAEYRELNELILKEGQEGLKKANAIQAEQKKALYQSPFDLVSGLAGRMKTLSDEAEKIADKFYDIPLTAAQKQARFVREADKLGKEYEANEAQVNQSLQNGWIKEDEAAKRHYENRKTYYNGLEKAAADYEQTISKTDNKTTFDTMADLSNQNKNYEQKEKEKKQNDELIKQQQDFINKKKLQGLTDRQINEELRRQEIERQKAIYGETAGWKNLEQAINDYYDAARDAIMTKEQKDYNNTLEKAGNLLLNYAADSKKNKNDTLALIEVQRAQAMKEVEDLIKVRDEMKKNGEDYKELDKLIEKLTNSIKEYYDAQKKAAEESQLKEKVIGALEYTQNLISSGMSLYGNVMNYFNQETLERLKSEYDEQIKELEDYWEGVLDEFDEQTDKMKEAMDEQQQLRDEAIKKQQDAEDRARARREKLLDQEIDARRQKEDEYYEEKYDTMVSELEKELHARLVAMGLEEAQSEAELELELERAKKTLNEKAILEAQNNLTRAKLEAEYQAKIDDIKKQQETTEAEVKAERQAEDDALEEQRYQAALIIAEQRTAAERERQKADKEMEIALEKQRETEKLALQKQYDDKKEAATLEYNRKVADIQYKQAMANYFAGIAQATLSAAIGVARASETGPFGVIPAKIMMAALGAIAIAAAVAAKPYKPTFASGGIVPGSSFSGDKVDVLANSGEMILNKKQQENILKLLSGNLEEKSGQGMPAYITVVMDSKPIMNTMINLINNRKYLIKAASVV